MGLRMREAAVPRPESPTSPNRDEHHRIDYVDVLAKHLLVSHAHTIACAAMIVASVIEVVWILLPHGGVGRLPDHPVFVLVESYVTLGLLAETALRVVLQRRDFLRSRATECTVRYCSNS